MFTHYLCFTLCINFSVSTDLLWRRSWDWKIQWFTCCRFDGRSLWTWFHVWCGNLLHCVHHVLPGGSRSLLWTLWLWSSFWGQKADSSISNSFGSLCMKKDACFFAVFFIAICNFCTLHLLLLPTLSSPFIFWVKNKIEWKPLGKRQSDERTKKAAAAAGGSSRSAFQFTTTHLSSLYTEKLEMEVDIPRDTSSKRFVLCIVYPRQIFIV